MNRLAKTNQIDVIILVGGKGSRLRELISDRPKPMAEINGEPFLNILISYISSYHLVRIILCVGHMSYYMRKHYEKKQYPLEIVFSSEDRPLGTAGAVKNAEKLIRTSPFLVMNGDSFCSVNLTEFIGFHTSRKAVASMVVAPANDKSSDYGSLEMNELHEIIRYEEKKSGQMRRCINGGIYLFEKEVLSKIPEDKNYSLEYNLFPALVNNKFYGFETLEPVIDIGTPERLERARKLLSR